MAEVQEKESGKKKKGAQKKMTIRVDFTPMVDMNMLLITFFMLCTTMIKSQTLKITLPNEDKNITEEQQSKVKDSQTITLILDTEYKVDDKGNTVPVVDENGKTAHTIYYYAGKPDTTFATNSFLLKQSFIGDTRDAQGERVHQGIRKILRKSNEQVMEKYEEYKRQWRDREISQEVFDSLAKLNRNDSNLTRPSIIIKPGPNTTYEALINALDEMQINQIARYNIQPTTHVDTILLEEYQRRHPGEVVIKENVRKSR